MEMLQDFSSKNGDKVGFDGDFSWDLSGLNKNHHSKNSSNNDNNGSSLGFNQSTGNNTNHA